MWVSSEPFYKCMLFKVIGTPSSFHNDPPVPANRHAHRDLLLLINGTSVLHIPSQDASWKLL